MRIGPDVVAAQARRSGSMLDNALTDPVFITDTQDSELVAEAGADTGLGHQFHCLVISN